MGLVGLEGVLGRVCLPVLDQQVQELASSWKS